MSISDVVHLIPLIGQGARTGVSVLQLTEIFEPLTPLVLQGVRTGVSVLQPRCGIITLLASACPCARCFLVSEAASFRTSLIL